MSEEFESGRLQCPKCFLWKPDRDFDDAFSHCLSDLCNDCHENCDEPSRDIGEPDGLEDGPEELDDHWQPFWTDNRDSDKPDDGGCFECKEIGGHNPRCLVGAREVDDAELQDPPNCLKITTKED